MSSKYTGLSYIKVLLTIYVVLHHAILAYVPGGPGVWVDDANNFEMWGLLATYFDQFFMFTFFFIAGLLSFNSIKRRGSLNYLIHRLVKYGLIFLFGTYLFNASMLYFKDLIIGTAWWVQYASLETFFNFVRDVNLMFHPAAHLWFLWVLLSFHIVFVILYNLTPIFNVKINVLKDPKLTIVITLSMMVIGYALFGIFFGFDFIQVMGPFTIQISRLIPYFTMFLLGSLIGKEGIENTFLNTKSKFSQNQWVWLILGASASLISFVVSSLNLNTYTSINLLLPMIAALFSTLGYIVTGLKYNKRMVLFDFLIPLTLTIYVVHYGLQALIHASLLSINVSGFIKGIIVFIVTMLISVLCAIFIKIIHSNIKKSIKKREEFV